MRLDQVKWDVFGAFQYSMTIYRKRTMNKPALSVAVLRGLKAAMQHVVTEDNWLYKHAGAESRHDLRRAKEWTEKMTEYRANRAKRGIKIPEGPEHTTIE